MSESRVWQRPRDEMIWSLVAFSLGELVIVGVIMNASTASASGLAKTVFDFVNLTYVLLSALLAYRVLAHARVIANAEGLLIRNPFRGDQEIKWSQIASMKSDRLLLIRDHTGATIVAWAIQKNGWSRARHIRTDADEAIDEMSKLANESLATSSIDFARSWVNAEKK